MLAIYFALQCVDTTGHFLSKCDGVIFLNFHLGSPITCPHFLRCPPNILATYVFFDMFPKLNRITQEGGVLGGVLTSADTEQNQQCLC